MLNSKYLAGPIKIDDVKSILVYSSKVTGLIPNRANYAVITSKVLSLKNSLGESYVPAKVINGVAEIVPSENLKISPKSGFDVIIYLTETFNGGDIIDFPVGYATFSEEVGKNNIDENLSESVSYRKIQVTINGVKEVDRKPRYISGLGTEKTEISDVTRYYLKPFKKRSELTFSAFAEEAIIPRRNCSFVTKTVILSEGSSEEDWKENDHIWLGAGDIIYYNDNDFRHMPLTTFGVDSYSGSSFLNGNDGGTPKKFYPKYICKKFVLDAFWRLWHHQPNNGSSYPSVGNFNYMHPMWIHKGESTRPSMNINDWTFFSKEVEQQPLLDIVSGTIVSEKSKFEDLTEAQMRIRELTDIKTPLTLLLDSQGRLNINVKIGSWFVFDLPQYEALVVSNPMTSVLVSNTSRFYPVNGKSLLVRSFEKLYLINSEGEFCDANTREALFQKNPASKFLSRFSTGGQLIDEKDIFNGPLNRYRRKALPKVDLRITAALCGWIFYYSFIPGENRNKVIIDYL